MKRGRGDCNLTETINMFWKINVSLRNEGGEAAQS